MEKVKLSLDIEIGIKKCRVPKLACNYDEKESHDEILNFINVLPEHFKQLMIILSKISFGSLSEEEKVKLLCQSKILYEELNTTGPWHTELNKTFASKLKSYVKDNFFIELSYMFSNTLDVPNQIIFEKCIENLHQNLNSQSWKKYPSQIEVYCALISEIQSYNVEVDPVKVLPASLLLMWDFNTPYKIMGLRSCLTVLKCLKVKSFKETNYQEAVYSILKKLMYEKDVKQNELTFECITELLNICPEFKELKLDEIMHIILNELYTESNFVRKSTYFMFLDKLIIMQQVNSVKSKKKIHSVISDSLNLCTNEDIKKLLLENTLMTLKTWIKYCWCVWNYQTDKIIIANLLKLLYIECECGKNGKLKTALLLVLKVLISLCSKSEICVIKENIESKMNLLSNKEFVKYISNKTIFD